MFILRRCNWLRHCDTSRKVVSFIPDGVTRIFRSCNPPDRTMSVEASQPLSARNTSLEPQTTGALRTCSGLYRVYLLHLFKYLHMIMCINV